MRDYLLRSLVVSVCHEIGQAGVHDSSRHDDVVLIMRMRVETTHIVARAILQDASPLGRGSREPSYEGECPPVEGARSHAARQRNPRPASPGRRGGRAVSA